MPRAVVDGSNIATEGRSTPSLRQLDEAVKAFKAEHPGHEVIVVVDATFAHRIDDEERPEFEEAASHNELVYPPAGAVGRGDAFLLAIADRTDAVVLSNDSFQEFHGEYDWLFDKGRLIGGMPVPGVGWVFVERNPVRGPKSREAVRQAKRTRARVGSKDASQPMPKPKAPPPAKRGKAAADDDDVRKAIDEATEEAVHPPEQPKRKRSRRRRGKGAVAEKEKVSTTQAKSGRGRSKKDDDDGGTDKPTLNEPLVFIEFIAEHKLGSTVEGTVDRFASHGAFVDVDGAQCYIPLTAMADPAPRSAKEVLTKGETREFVVQALDAPRRGVELAIPGFEEIAGQPTDETVEAEITESKPKAKSRSRRRRPRKAAEAAKAETAAASVPEEEPKAKKAAAKKTAAKKTAAKKAAAKKGTAKKAAAKKETAKKATTKKAPAKKTAAKKAPAKKAAAKEGTAKKAAATKETPKKTAAKKAPAKKAAAKKETPKKAASKKAAAKKAAAKKETPKKAASKKAAAKKEPAKKAAAKKTGAKKATRKKSSG